MTAATRPLTDRQMRQLRTLLAVGALNRETAASAYALTVQDLGSPLVLGKLRDSGLVRSRVVRQPGRSQHTAYWLTLNGAAVAEVLAEASTHA